MTKVFFNGECVQMLRTNNKEGSVTYGYAGQDLGNGKIAVYVPAIGICAVTKGTEPETVHISEVLLPRATIRAKLLSAFKGGKKLSFIREVACEGEAVLQLVELEVNEGTVDEILRNLCLNTQKGKRTGVCLRDVNGCFENLAAIGRIIREYSAQELISLHEAWSNGCNNGNFCEFIVGGNKRALTHRYEDKVNDVLYNDGIHKSKRRAELKASLKTICKAAKSSASNTNQLVYISLK